LERGAIVPPHGDLVLSGVRGVAQEGRVFLAYDEPGLERLLPGQARALDA